MTNSLKESLAFIAAPMVNQSDLPFRILVGKYDATMTYTQMLLPDKLIHDQQYLEYHLRDLTLAANHDYKRPVVVQLCGDNPQVIVDAGRKLQGYCDGIDLNLGCPQQAALEGHFGAYLLGQKDWPLVQEIVSKMSHSFTVPVSTKMRLCQPQSDTLRLAQQLEASGSAWVTLHARTVSARRRRQGAADLDEVRNLKEHLTVPVVSNGNVRAWDDLRENGDYTGADGLMVGETLLGNPCLFANIVPDPVQISLEYLNICRDYPGTATMSTVQTHVRHFIEFQCGRRPWYRKFRAAIVTCQTLDDVEKLLKLKVTKWRGKSARPHHAVAGEEVDSEDDVEGQKLDLFDLVDDSSLFLGFPT